MDITQLILDDHQEQRRLFAILEQTTENDVEALRSVWNRLSVFLTSAFFVVLEFRHSEQAGGGAGMAGERAHLGSFRPFLDARATIDGRIIVGGEDENFVDAERRDAMIGQKRAALENAAAPL